MVKIMVNFIFTIIAIEVICFLCYNSNIRSYTEGGGYSWQNVEMVKVHGE